MGRWIYVALWDWTSQTKSWSPVSQNTRPGSRVRIRQCQLDLIVSDCFIIITVFGTTLDRIYHLLHDWPQQFSSAGCPASLRERVRSSEWSGYSSKLVVLWRPTWACVPGLFQMVEAPGKTRDTLEGLRLSADMKATWDPTTRPEWSVREEGGLDFSARTAASMTQSQIYSLIPWLVWLIQIKVLNSPKCNSVNQGKTPWSRCKSGHYCFYYISWFSFNQLELVKVSLCV